MEAELDGMNAGMEQQGINIRGQCRGEVIANAGLAAFLEIASFPEIILRLVEDLNPHSRASRSRAFTPP